MPAAKSHPTVGVDEVKSFSEIMMVDIGEPKLARNITIDFVKRNADHSTGNKDYTDYTDYRSAVFE